MEERRLTVYAELRLLVPLPLLSLLVHPIDVPPPNSWFDSSITRRFERRGEGAHIPILSPAPENVNPRGNSSETVHRYKPRRFIFILFYIGRIITPHFKHFISNRSVML